MSRKKTNFKLGLAVILSLAVFFGCASGTWAPGRGGQDSGEAVKAAAFPQNQPLLLKVYIIEGASAEVSAGAKLYAEGMYVPQGAAAFFPTRFELSGKERRLLFTTDLAYRIMARTELGGGVWVYTVEASLPAREEASGRRYTVSFPRGALGPEGGESVQPASYALQRGIRLANLDQGLVRLESLGFDENAGMFKAVVVVGAY